MSEESPPAPANAAPSSFEELRDALLHRLTALPKRLAQVAHVAISTPDEIAFGTAASVAKAAGVQPSTLVRFAQAFGYSGFSALQDTFRDRLRDRPLSYEDRLRTLRDAAGQGAPGVTQVGALFEGFAEVSQHSVQRLKHRVDHENLAAAAGLMTQAETIYLVGLRRSFPAMSYMAYVLSKLRIKNMLVGSADTVAFANPGDAAIVVTFAPYASAAVDYAERMHKADVPVVAITDGPFSPLNRLATICFEVIETDFHGFRPLAATMVLLTTLAVSVAELRAGRQV